MCRNLFSFDQPQPGFPLVPPSIGGPIGGKYKIWAKCWSEWQDLNLRPPRPERGALPDCATLRLPEGRPYNRVPPAPQAQVSAMTAPPATRVIKAQATKDGAADTAAEPAARVLRAGGLVAFPTETVYGLGADATNGEAVARLYAAKGRPSFNPLIAHVTDVGAARTLARFDQAAERLAEAFWPGPLTLVLPRRADCPVAELATAGLDTIAVRVPSHPVARAILAAFGARWWRRRPTAPATSRRRPRSTCWPICAAASI